MKDNFDGYVMVFFGGIILKSPILFFYISIQYILFVFLCHFYRILDKYFVSLFFYFRYHNFFIFCVVSFRRVNVFDKPLLCLVAATKRRLSSYNGRTPTRWDHKIVFRHPQGSDYHDWKLKNVIILYDELLRYQHDLVFKWW